MLQSLWAAGIASLQTSKVDVLLHPLLSSTWYDTCNHRELPSALRARWEGYAVATVHSRLRLLPSCLRESHFTHCLTTSAARLLPSCHSRAQAPLWSFSVTICQLSLLNYQAGTFNYQLATVTTINSELAQLSMEPGQLRRTPAWEEPCVAAEPIKTRGKHT